jgi:pimeloyl-ACP methyl ester carboxylesterase
MVQRGVASTTRICAYDRAGEGWSGGHVSGQRLASDLHRLLRTAGIRGPYVLACHSVGGVYSLIYAAPTRTTSRLSLSSTPRRRTSSTCRTIPAPTRCCSA